MRIRVFGATEVETAHGTVSGRVFGGVKPRQILEILTLHRGHFIAKDQIADMLWDGTPPANHIATLESYVSVLRGKVQPGVARRESVIATGNGCYGLDMSQVVVDLDEFDQLVRRSAELEAEASLLALREALDLFRGPVLEQEPYAAWASAHRERYDMSVGRAMVTAAQKSFELRDSENAVRLADAAAGLNALDEAACQIGMRAEWSAGRRAHALKRYERFRGTLREGLGIDPHDRTQALYVAILRADRIDPDTGAHELGTLVQAVVDLYQRTHSTPASTSSARRVTWLTGPPERLLGELVARAGAASANLPGALPVAG